MSKVYVKLRDRGTIFHDSSQSIAVSGDAIVAVEKEGRVEDAINAGILQIVPDKEAEVLLAKTAEEKAKAIANSSSNSDAVVAELSAKYAELTEQHEEEVRALKGQVENLEKEVQEKDQTIKELSEKVAAFATETPSESAGAEEEAENAEADVNEDADAEEATDGEPKPAKAAAKK